MDKFDLLHYTLYAIPELGNEETAGGGDFIKFLLNKYDEDILRQALETTDESAFIYADIHSEDSAHKLEYLKKRFA